METKNSIDAAKQAIYRDYCTLVDSYAQEYFNGIKKQILAINFIAPPGCFRIIEVKFSGSYSACMEILDIIESEAKAKSSSCNLYDATASAQEIKKDVEEWEKNKSKNCMLTLIVPGIMRMKIDELNELCNWIKGRCSQKTGIPYGVILIGTVFRKDEELYSKLFSSVQTEIDFDTFPEIDFLKELKRCLSSIVTSNKYAMRYSPTLLFYLWQMIQFYNPSLRTIAKSLKYCVFNALQKSNLSLLFCLTNGNDVDNLEENLIVSIFGELVEKHKYSKY